MAHPLQGRERMGSDSKRTMSTHITEAVQGTHSFNIIGYSHHKGIGVGQYIESDIFTVGGFDWAIRFYPDGFCESNKECVAMDLNLMSKNAEVRASHHMSLINPTTRSVLRVSETTPRFFNSRDGTFFSTVTLVPRSRLESKTVGYVVKNSLRIECTVNVIQNSKFTGDMLIELPDRNMSEHFGKLLDGEGADFRFIVGEQTFLAHKIILAARSPVFKALLYGQMKEGSAQCISIEDIQPDVFKALLHFIYTDELPKWDGLDNDDCCEINRHLLVAADRYGMERLKLLCASTLADKLDTETVATTLALADQHNCNVLKDICIEFMASLGKMDAIVATQGYASLKRTCPSLLVDVLEKSSRCRRA